MADTTSLISRHQRCRRWRWRAESKLSRCSALLLFENKSTCTCIVYSIRAPDGGCQCLVSILRMAACPVSLAQSLCHCVTNERTLNLVNYAASNVIFHWISICIAFHNSWFNILFLDNASQNTTSNPKITSGEKRKPAFIDFCVGKAGVVSRR